MAWKESDDVTADDLLPEMIEYARKMLADLASARVTGNLFGNKGVSSIDVNYSSDFGEGMKKLLSDRGRTVIESEPYEAGHPGIIGAFRTAFVKMMEVSGYRYMQGKKYSELLENEFSNGGTFSLMNISSFGVSCKTTPEELREALTVKDEALLALVCLEALEERLAEMREFKARMEKAGIDLAKEFDPLSFVRELQEAGLPAPEVIELGEDGPEMLSDPKKGGPVLH